jgi:predicted phage terminase large subunit-like protein
MPRISSVAVPAPSPVEEASAVFWEMERRGLYTPNYGRWLEKARADYRWDYPHFRLMQDTLNRVTAGIIKRALFQVAIRHGKTEHNTIGYAAYRLEKDPSTRILFGTYGILQARKVSRAIRKLCRARGVQISRKRDSVDEWETTDGGGLRAVGRGSGTASVNADLIIVDDPLGNRAEAESLAIREACWDWMTDDIFSRREPHTAIIFSMPRWHVDDPAGRLQDRQAGRWEIVDLPGEAEPGDPLGRALEEPLWPEHRPQSWLEDMRGDLGSYGFASLVQGRPRPRVGGMFHWDWWGLLRGIPGAGRMVRYWDLAGTLPKGKRHDPDYTCGALLCRMLDNRTAVVDVERFRYSVAMRDARMLEIANQDMQDYPNRVEWWIEKETGIEGERRTQDLLRKLHAIGLTARTEPATGSKVYRAEPLAAAAEAGNVLLCPGEWRDSFRLEAANFTGEDSGHDDQVDSVGAAYAKLGQAQAEVMFTHARM